MTKQVHVSVNWDNLDSIKAAEKTKATLENKGYKLANHFGGIFHTVYTYIKTSDPEVCHKCNMHLAEELGGLCKHCAEN